MTACVAIIIKDREVVAQPGSVSVRQAARVMAERRIGAVAVTEGRHLIGIFTERDIVCRVVAAGRDLDRTRLIEVMTRRPETVSGECSLDEALQIMMDGGFRHLPVMVRGELLGVISLRDVSGREERVHPEALQSSCASV